jgi:hypothetical protein
VFECVGVSPSEHSELLRNPGQDVERTQVLAAERASDESLMHNASGQTDLALIPEHFEAGVIDLWSVNLVASVLPTLDTAPTSVIYWSSTPHACASLERPTSV